MTDRAKRQYWLRRIRDYFRAVEVVREFEAEQSQMISAAYGRKWGH